MTTACEIKGAPSSDCGRCSVSAICQARPWRRASCVIPAACRATAKKYVCHLLPLNPIVCGHHRSRAPCRSWYAPARASGYGTLLSPY